MEQHCDNAATVFTYNSEDKILGGVTYGGYSESIVVGENFVLRVPDGLDPAGAAPLSVPASPLIRRCGIGRSARVRRLASLD